MRNIYKELSKSVAGKIVVFIDACFSGKTDPKKLIFKGVAPGLIKTKKTRFNKRKMVIFKAGSSYQFSNSFDKEKHRLFTYFLIKNLLKNKKPRMKSVYNNLKKQVKKMSWKEKGDAYLQVPQFDGDFRLGF